MPSLLLDTQLLLWRTFEAGRLSLAASELLTERAKTVHFSTVSIWEVAIKYARRKPDFVIDPVPFRHLLLANGFIELNLTPAHILATVDLPPIHKDPFDRILIAQALVEHMQLLTADTYIARYPGPILKV